MDAFGITAAQKRLDPQYWGRELGMCWQLIVAEICRQTRCDFRPPIRIGSQEPCDLIVGRCAIDTKYRIGSGDSGTLKRIKSYGRLLAENDYEPTMLILRDDNLPAAVTACRSGGWSVLTGQDTLDYIRSLTGFCPETFLRSMSDPAE